MRYITKMRPLLTYLIFVLGLFSIFMFGCQTEPEPEKQGTTSVETDSWELIFEDEFNDLEAWNIWYGGAFNNEIQLYRGEQLSIDGSVLRIKAKRQNITGPSLPIDPSPKEFEYVSARIESKQLYGPSNQEGESAYRFMARIKLPFGHGMWPAFWTYGDPWPTQGEIDILEARGTETHEFGSNIFYGPDEGISINHDTEVRYKVKDNLTEDFHIFEMIWYADSIQIKLDSELLQSYHASDNNNIDKLFGKKQKIVLNTAVGGWYFKDDESANYADSSMMEVDWVRVYKK